MKEIRSTPTALGTGTAETASAAAKLPKSSAPSESWRDLLSEQAMHTLWNGSDDEDARVAKLDAILDALENMSPKDELEGMMVTQMIAAHNTIMECFRRAMLPNQTILGREENLGHADKLLRSFAKLVDTFNKHRGQVQQKVLVEHVHVHPGGQAVVGLVSSTRGRGGHEK